MCIRMESYYIDRHWTWIEQVAEKYLLGPIATDSNRSVFSSLTEAWWWPIPQRWGYPGRFTTFTQPIDIRALHSVPSATGTVCFSNAQAHVDASGWQQSTRNSRPLHRKSDQAPRRARDPKPRSRPTPNFSGCKRNFWTKINDASPASPYHQSTYTFLGVKTITKWYIFTVFCITFADNHPEESYCKLTLSQNKSQLLIQGEGWGHRIAPFVSQSKRQGQQFRS